MRFGCRFPQAEDVGGGPGEPLSRRLTVEDGKVDDRMVLDALKQAGGILAQVRASLQGRKGFILAPGPGRV